MNNNEELNKQNGLKDEILEQVNGGVLPLTPPDPGYNLDEPAPKFRVHTRVTCFRGIHWSVLEVYPGSSIAYKVEACEIPDEWLCWISVGGTSIMPESEFHGGWD